MLLNFHQRRAPLASALDAADAVQNRIEARMLRAFPAIERFRFAASYPGGRYLAGAAGGNGVGTRDDRPRMASSIDTLWLGRVIPMARSYCVLAWA